MGTLKPLELCIQDTGNTVYILWITRNLWNSAFRMIQSTMETQKLMKLCIQDNTQYYGDH